jgi:hypothetical protein
MNDEQLLDKIRKDFRSHLDQPAKLNLEQAAKLSQLLRQCIDIGKYIEDAFMRTRYERTAQDLGDAIFKVSDTYPETQLQPYIDEPMREIYDKSIFLCNVPYCNELFVGRKSQLDELNKKLSSLYKVLVYGLGGIGKTQIALKYSCDSITVLA